MSKKKEAKQRKRREQRDEAAKKLSAKIAAGKKR